MQREDSCNSIINFSSKHGVTRRNMFSSAFGSAAFVAALVPQTVRAEDPLFRPNPLTNKFLEKVSSFSVAVFLVTTVYYFLQSYLPTCHINMHFLYSDKNY
jgi:hypothetical protein